MRTPRHTHSLRSGTERIQRCVCVCVCVHCCTSGAISIAPSRNSSQTLVIESLLHHCTATNINITGRGGAVRCETKFHYQLTDRRPTPYSDMVNPQISVETEFLRSHPNHFFHFRLWIFEWNVFRISKSVSQNVSQVVRLLESVSVSIDRWIDLYYSLSPLTESISDTDPIWWSTYTQNSLLMMMMMIITRIIFIVISLVTIEGLCAVVQWAWRWWWRCNLIGNKRTQQ